MKGRIAHAPTHGLVQVGLHACDAVAAAPGFFLRGTASFQHRGARVLGVPRRIPLCGLLEANKITFEAAEWHIPMLACRGDWVGVCEAGVNQRESYLAALLFCGVIVRNQKVYCTDIPLPMRGQRMMDALLAVCVKLVLNARVVGARVIKLIPSC